MKKKIALITGVTGQDGSYLAEFLLKKKYLVHGIIRRSSSFNTSRIDHLYQDPHEKTKNFYLHYGDMTDSLSLQRIINEIKPDEIYNLAAQSHVAVSFQQPEYTANSDGLGALRILEIIKNIKSKKIKFYQAGTSAAGRLTINIKVMDQLKLANELGETIIIATASPRVYVSAILDELGVPRSKVIGTEVDLGTGHISGGECSREAKWDAVREELKTLQVSTIKAYGNAPDDLFMLKQVDQGFLVKGSLIRLSKM